MLKLKNLISRRGKPGSFRSPFRWYPCFCGLFAIALFFQTVFAQRGASPETGRPVPLYIIGGQDGTAPARAPDPAVPAATRSQASKTEINEKIPNDAAVDNMLGPYSAKVRALDVVIGKLQGEVRKGGVGGGSLGYFVADGIRARASKLLGRPVPIVFLNSGGLRRAAITRGQLRIRDIFELLPFENELVEVSLTGKQLLKVLGSVAFADDAQSGAKIRYRINADNRPELVSARLTGAHGKDADIDPAATYRAVTIDYLLKLKSGNYAILQEAKEVKPLGITIREGLIYYVKAETAAGRLLRPKSDGRFVLLGAGPRRREEAPQ